MNAQYSGAGVELGAPSVDGGYMVVAPLPGSPAEEAGVVPGDRLLAIDGEENSHPSRDPSIDSSSHRAALRCRKSVLGSHSF
jgi:carboxyl-terminal processing protease